MQGLLKTEADMQVKLQDLGGQIEALQAKLEDTNYRLSQLSQQIAATNQELKSFRNQPAAAAGRAGSTMLGAPPPQPPARPPAPEGGGGAGIDPKSLYDAAYNDYLKGNFDLAMREFQEYLANFPATDLSDNAAYWIGESYYRQRRFRQAIDQFDVVLNRYPKGDKVPSALLKKGYSLPGARRAPAGGGPAPARHPPVPHERRGQPGAAAAARGRGRRRLVDRVWG